MPTLTRRQLRAHFGTRDPVMAALLEAAGPYRLRAMECATPFRHLCEAIIGQQISGRAAAAILRRFREIFETPGGEPAFPQPQQVLQQESATLRAAGLSAGKVQAIFDLAAKTLAGLVPDTAGLRALEDREIIERLTAVRGIGPWTVQMMLMFQLGRPDVLPAADYGVRNGFRLAYRLRELPTPRELLRYGECWAPYRSAAAWYLWRAVDLEAAGVSWRRPLRRASSTRGAGAAQRPRRGARTR